MEPKRHPGGLLTQAQLARRLQVTPTTIRRWRRFGGMPFFRIGKAVWFEWRAILRWAKQRAKDPDAMPRLSRPTPPVDVETGDPPGTGDPGRFRETEPG